MKIVFATHEGVPLYGGGPDVKIKALTTHLRDLGVDVQLFDLWNAREQLFNCDLVHLFGANFAVYNLARNLKYQNIKFVVNPIFYSRRNPKIIRAISRIDLLIRKIWQGVWWQWGFTRDICNWSEMVLPNTIAEGELLRQSYDLPSAKIRVLHNGVSAHFLNSDPAPFIEKYGIRDFILHVGHLGPARKNVLNLVRALEKIDHPTVLIDRILQTGETPEILSAIRKNPNILFIEGLPNTSAMLASAYAASSVFVLPSQFETPGRAALEAALAGAKIVITPHGGTTEYFGDYATYVNPADVSDIQRGIETALQVPKFPDLPQHIAQHFSWEKIASETKAVYESILSDTAKNV